MTPAPRGVPGAGERHGVCDQARLTRRLPHSNLSPVKHPLDLHLAPGGGGLGRMLGLLEPYRDRLQRPLLVAPLLYVGE
jgi:hypothetical protein